ncbi:hypothetical protein JHK82_046903 [Glycine max]|nr:hypothetical protein JHK86_046792 [Glycine max]KAG4932586.1 hypothetical protein JHK87_046588 [Glycine soja]KAG4942712.1 hypothetical protein JHK85_047358 [Glycine max]KAG5097049.1 hypothetical protein JHK82_046903 [Glycine max]KAG5101835.1 hypothetical protein JHK84_046804 [Glycine max]
MALVIGVAFAPAAGVRHLYIICEGDQGEAQPVAIGDMFMDTVKKGKPDLRKVLPVAIVR